MNLSQGYTVGKSSFAEGGEIISDLLAFMDVDRANVWLLAKKIGE
jgi:hypothetical protein